MGDFFRILGNLVRDNLLVILFFSVSWVFIYLILQFLRWLVKNLFVRYWYYVRLRLWRIRAGTEDLVRRIYSGETIDSELADSMSGLVARRIGVTDRRLSRIATGSNLASILLDKASLHEAIEMIMGKALIQLEQDDAVFGIFSKNKRKREIGILNLISNPKTDRLEMRKILFRLLEADSYSTRKQALFHLKSQINTPDELRKLWEIISDWPEELRPEGEKAVKGIEPRILRVNR